MATPEHTSAAAVGLYAPGKKIAESKGEAWKDVHLTILSLPPVAECFAMPSVPEPFIAWVTSGEAEAQEREGKGPWLTTRLRKNSMFLTAAGAPYDFRWKTLSDEPYEVVLVLLSVPLFNEAVKDVFGPNAPHASLRDLSGLEDALLVPLLTQLRQEVLRPKASRLLVRGLAQAIAVHLARSYTVLGAGAKGESSSLPGFKLKRVTDWMAQHLQEEFSLPRLAEQAGMSEFHFNRLFKRATGLPPSQYQIQLRIQLASRLLRETERSVITIANEVGYSNPSHFAQLFKKETGLSPTEYRRRR